MVLKPTRRTWQCRKLVGARLYGGDMTPRQVGLRAPSAYVVTGTWPNARLGGPYYVRYAQVFARRLILAVGERSLRGVAREAGLSHSTLLAVVHGDRWPDMVTIAKLEETLDADLWPGQELRRVHRGDGQLGS
jgi:lambda repressor-like predicted transcriptional regulator